MHLKGNLALKIPTLERRKVSITCLDKHIRKKDQIKAKIEKKSECKQNRTE